MLGANLSVLITTNTMLSADYVKKTYNDRVIHQFMPIDYKLLIKKFLIFWRPNIIVIIESEIWPNLIFTAKSFNIPVCLIQAGFSRKSLKKWSYFSISFQNILSVFKMIVAKSKTDKTNIEKLAKVKVDRIYNYKFSTKKLTFSKNELSKISANIKNKLVISALSTHKGEEKIILESFTKLNKKFKNLILILQPRHPIRAKQIEKKIKSFDLKYKIRSSKNYPDDNTSVYLSDTFGDSGVIIAVSDIVINGGTFVKVGGHNIIETAQFGKCMIIGPYFHKIKDVVTFFLEKKALVLTKPDYIEKQLYKLLKDKKYLSRYGKNAINACQYLNKPDKFIFKNLIKLVEKHENTSLLV